MYNTESQKTEIFVCLFFILNFRQDNFIRVIRDQRVMLLMQCWVNGFHFISNSLSLSFFFFICFLYIDESAYQEMWSKADMV